MAFRPSAPDRNRKHSRGVFEIVDPARDAAMADKRKGKKLPSRFEREMMSNVLRIRMDISANDLWERILSEEDREGLGGDLKGAFKKLGTAGMWMKLRGVSYGRAVAELARVLGHNDEQTHQWLLRELGETDDPSKIVERVIASGALVLIQTSREVHWRGTLINCPWERYRVLWDFFWQLAANAKVGKPLDWMDLGTGNDQQIVAKRKSRLLDPKNGVPADLGDRIVRVGKGTIRLDVPAADIRLFEQSSSGSAREFFPPT
jgi:hypothetical protein